MIGPTSDQDVAAAYRRRALTHIAAQTPLNESQRGRGPVGRHELTVLEDQIAIHQREAREPGWQKKQNCSMSAPPLLRGGERRP
jgi:hypothetical protein